MKKQIQLYTMIGDITLKGSTHQIEPFYNAIKKLCERMWDKSMHGTVKITCESSDIQATKRWDMKIICPPLPQNHPYHYKLEAIIEACSFDKRVCSWGSVKKETAFGVNNEKN